MIRSFADKRTEGLFKFDTPWGVPPDLIRRAKRKLNALHVATRLADLATTSGNRLHSLRGDREGQYAIAVNDQWRICFRFVDRDAFDVEFCDYH